MSPIMYKPELAGEWRLLFRPQKQGNYVNDHAILQAGDGRWHLFGITGFGDTPSQERYFVHGASRSLAEPMEELGRVVDTGSLAWAPGVIEHGGSYYMYYGPSPTRMAVSPDLCEWMGYEINLSGHPPMACHRDHMVRKLNDYTWIMYASGIYRGYGCISCFVSNDLINWRFVQYALTCTPGTPLAPAWGALESPYVVEYAGLYYLFVTYTDCRTENYQNTLVFCSANPYDFGRFGESSAQPVARLNSHAGEVLFEVNSGQYFITTCGWRGKGIPHEGGVSIAPLRWVEEK